MRASETIYQEGLSDSSAHKTVRTELAYDGYGNVSLESALGVVGVSGDELYTETEYVTPTSRWLIRLPARERVYDRVGSSDCTETLTFYDGEAFAGLPQGQATEGFVSRVTDKVDASGAVLNARRAQRDGYAYVANNPGSLVDPSGLGGGGGLFSRFRKKKSGGGGGRQRANAVQRPAQRKKANNIKMFKVRGGTKAPSTAAIISSGERFSRPKKKANQQAQMMKQKNFSDELKNFAAIGNIYDGDIMNGAESQKRQQKLAKKKAAEAWKKKVQANQAALDQTLKDSKVSANPKVMTAIYQEDMMKKVSFYLDVIPQWQNPFVLLMGPRPLGSGRRSEPRGPGARYHGGRVRPARPSALRHRSAVGSRSRDLRSGVPGSIERGSAVTSLARGALGLCLSPRSLSRPSSIHYCST